MVRKLSLFYIVLALVMIQVAEILPHHHHDGTVVFCMDEDGDEDEADDDALCITRASYMSDDTHHGLDLTACLPYRMHVDIPEPQSLGEEVKPSDQNIPYIPYHPGPSALRAPPVSSL